MAIFTVVFAAALLAGTVAAASDNMAFATHGKQIKQVKSQNAANQQTLVCQASGGVSIGSGSSALGIGLGAGVSPNAGVNLCFNANNNNNVDSGNQAATNGQQNQ